ncbi:MAG: hypothetical protein V1859_01375 [archaeon]
MTSDDSSVKIIGNIELHEDEGYAILSVNPKFYPLDIVYSASYTFLDRAYIFLNGNPEEEILVELRYKENNGDLEILARDFNNELINYAVYQKQSEKNRDIRQAFVNKITQTNSDCACDNDNISPDNIEDNYIDDPLGIAKPWEETHGNQDDSTSEKLNEE